MCFRRLKGAFLRPEFCSAVRKKIVKFNLKTMRADDVAQCSADDVVESVVLASATVCAIEQEGGFISETVT